ncbi:hypothetical protein SAMN02800694_0742 [Luteibacter sp. UNCMF331Sha3.1]|uniref:hypothetical protein n=1 Tax=Luteibacter sp. UNCMF331Sha3.1 TaxID=1502760 RepID=UPI0008D2BA53|nr:hypothetical protein [Luteibacter sp. UNCMF331Sha3.1]SEM35026.1 hypothetical protein SAMN02800694_0742 [Luteibacter sp. UNCMF331Sha3.1]
MRHHAFSAACVVLLLPAKALAMHCTASHPVTHDIVVRGLLDPSVSIERRKRLADRLLCSALAGNAASQELAGELYFEGPARKGNVLPRDLSRARRLLTAAADHGRRHAMHDLARLELADHHPYRAAMWTRVETALHGPPPAGVAPLHERVQRRVTPDSRLDAEVAAKVRAVREAMGKAEP